MTTNRETRSREILGELTDTTMIARFRELEIHLVHGPEAPATLEHPSSSVDRS